MWPILRDLESGSSVSKLRDLLKGALYMRVVRRLLVLSLLLAGLALPVLADCDPGRHTTCVSDAYFTEWVCMTDGAMCGDPEACYAQCDANFAADMQACDENYGCF